MAKYDINFELNGIPCDPPKNWQDIEIVGTYFDDLQPIIENDEFTFVNENATNILAFIENHGAFQGMRFTMNVYGDFKTGALKGQNANIIYNTCLDFTEGFEIISPVEVKCKVKVDVGLDLFDKRLEAVSYGYLADRGFFNNSDYTDVPVVIRKKFDAVETAMASIALYMIQKELREALNQIKKETIEKLATALAAPLQKPAEFFKAAATILLFIAYRAAMLIVMIQMVRTILNNLLPKPTKYKGITLRKALEKALDYLDIRLDCDIPEIDYYIYLPSKTDDKIRKNRKDEGLPNTSDFGYQCSEMLQLVYMLFRGKGFMVVNGSQQTLVIRAAKSEQLRRVSQYQLPDHLAESFTYNTNDLKANFIISFQYDPSDEYTMPNARDTPFDSKKKDAEKERYEKGVAYEVLTDVKDVLDNRYKLNKGLEEIRIPLALGARRSNLSVFEVSAQVLLSVVDVVIKLFGGKTFGEKIDEGRGRLIISHNSFSIAKLICLQGGLIPQNHRDLLSARALYEKYHYWRSFVSNPTYSQMKVYKNIKIPFGFDDFTQTQKFSNFTTSSGLEGNFTSIKWRLSADYAIVDYNIYHKYTSNLTETPIET